MGFFMVCPKGYITLQGCALCIRLTLSTSSFYPVVTRMCGGCIHSKSIKNADLMDLLWTHHGLTMDSPQKRGVFSDIKTAVFWDMLLIV